VLNQRVTVGLSSTGLLTISGRWFNPLGVGLKELVLARACT
jgi:hypothetical protein